MNNGGQSKQHVMDELIKIRKTSILSRWPCTTERRLVTISKKSPIDVVDIGFFRVPLYSKFDSLAFVNMGPQNMEVEISGNVGTSDGVTITGKVSVQVKVNDNPDSIKKLVANEFEEQKMLHSSVIAAVQSVFSSSTWLNVISTNENLTESTHSKLLETLMRTNSCFLPLNLTFSEIAPKKQALAESLENAAETISKEKSKKDLLKQSSERIELERNLRKKEFEAEKEIQKLKIELEKEREAHKLNLEKMRKEALFSIQKKISELLKTEEGRIAVLPDQTYQLLMKEIEAKISGNEEMKKIYRDVLRTTQSFRAGQFSAMATLAEKRLGITLKEDSNLLEGNTDEEESPKTDKPSDESKSES